MVEFKIQAYVDREKLVMALVNSGYKVKVVTKPRPNKYLQVDYFVQVEEDNEKSENTMELKTYDEWEKIIKEKHGFRCLTKLGYRKLCDEGREKDLLAYDEFEKYYRLNTLIASFS